MKLCGKCRELKTYKEFYRNTHKPDGYQSYCKLCNKLWVRNNYVNNKDYFVSKAKLNLQTLKRRVCEYLSTHPCVDCGEPDIIVLDFDHVTGDKILDISGMLNRKLSWATIEAEIAKCEVRCANCHRRITAKRNPTFKYSWVADR